MITTSIFTMVFSLTAIFANPSCRIIPLELDCLDSKTTCITEPGNVKTYRAEKNRKFLFWKLPHKKVIITDEYVLNDRIIFKKVSKSICSPDACSDIKYRRIKIVNGEVWIFSYNANPENAMIKRYDINGKYLGKKKWTEESFEDH